MRSVISSERGYSTLNVQKNYLYICVPRSLMGGKQKRIATGLRDVPSNRREATKVMALIDADIDNGIFDTSLQKYSKLKRNRDIQTQLNIFEVDLETLYEEYTEVRKIGTSPATHKSVYGHNLAQLRKCPHKRIMDAHKISEWATKNLSRSSATRLLVQVNACVKWAVGIGRLPNINNPYPAAIEAIESKKKKGGEIEYYTAQQRDIIIATLPDYCLASQQVYADLIAFLFLSGCRYSEAIAIDRASWDGRKLLIDKAVVEGLDGLTLTDTLKTEEQRLLPVTPRLRDLLDRLCVERNGLLFPSPRTKSYIAYNTFAARFWRPLLQYVNDRHPDVPIYSLRATRRTYITLALDAGLQAQEVAKLVGNSPQVIYNHYAGTRKRDALVDF